MSLFDVKISLILEHTHSGGTFSSLEISYNGCAND